MKMNDSSEWELSKENVQPLRHGRNLSSLTSALQHNPSDLQQIKEQKDKFEKQLRLYAGNDPLELWDCYIKWTEQNFPRGGRDGNLMELLQRCLTHFKDHDEYKNDPRFVGIWVKFASFMDDPLEIYVYMFDQKIGCELSILYEEWASFLERLGNTKKANAIYLEGIKRGAQPLDVLNIKHHEFQVRVARRVTLQQDPEEEEIVEEQRIVLGHLKADKKNHVTANRTGAAKIGSIENRGTSHPVPPQQTNIRFQVFQDENQPHPIPVQTGEWKTIPQKEMNNRENEKTPGVWTNVKVPQRRGVVPLSVIKSAEPVFQIHEDENASRPHPAAVVDSTVLSARKADKPGHVLDPIRKTDTTGQERLCYCKDKIYCGIQEFSFEEIRALRVMEKRKKVQLEEERLKMEHQLEEMRQMRDQMKKDMERMRMEAQLIAMHRQPQVTHLETPSQEHMSMQSSLRAADILNQNTPIFTPSLKLSGSSANMMCDKSAGLTTAPLSGQPNANLNNSQFTPVSNSSVPCLTSSSAGKHLHHSHSSGPTPESNSSKHSLTSVSPTINMKEALNLVQGMYNATLDCDKINSIVQDTEMAIPAQQSAPIVVFDETIHKSVQPVIPIFCDENVDPKSRVQAAKSLLSRGTGFSGVRNPLKDKPVTVEPCETVHHFKQLALDDEPTGTEFFSHENITLAAVGSQESFSAAAHAASTPFGLYTTDGHRLPSLLLSSNKSAKIMHLETDEEMTTEPANHNQRDDVLIQGQQPHVTFCASRLSPNKISLSPITEGSTEGSSEESKAASTFATSHSLTSATKAPLTGNHGSNHTSISASDSFPKHLESMKQHVIDISSYTPPEVSKQEALLSTSVCIDPHNPFDEATINIFLKRLQPPLSKRENFIICNQLVPSFHNCHFINLGDDTYQLSEQIGEGGYAKVYRASNFGTNFDDITDCDIGISSSCVIKVQKPAAPWEFYICSEVHARLKVLGGQFDMSPSIMEISKGYFYQDGSCLISSYCGLGSLLTLVNHIKGKRQLMVDLEPFAAFITIQLLRTVEAIHRCQIIHGDIKPDNILLTDFPELPMSKDAKVLFGPQNNCLKLVDFGQAIDMSLYPPGTTFLAKVGTSGFQCIEMMTDQPWTYQTDMFGLIGSIHVLVFGTYMKVYSSQGQWHMTSNFQRKWKVDLWKKLFFQLLNIPDCDKQPDIAALCCEFEEHFINNLLCKFNTLVSNISAIYL